VSAIRFDRLVALAEHLEKGKLGHDLFFFGVWHDDNATSEDFEILPEGFCGTVGCAVGECPSAFPDQWTIQSVAGESLLLPVLRRDSGGSPDSDAVRFFGLTSDQCDHLFIPGCQDPDEFAGEHLRADSPKEQVAANIRAFVEKMQESK